MVAGHCPKHLAYPISLSLYNETLREISLSCLMYRWENWGTRRLSYLPMVTNLESSRVVIQLSGDYDRKIITIHCSVTFSPHLASLFLTQLCHLLLNHPHTVIEQAGPYFIVHGYLLGIPAFVLLCFLPPQSLIRQPSEASTCVLHWICSYQGKKGTPSNKPNAYTPY